MRRPLGGAMNVPDEPAPRSEPAPPDAAAIQPPSADIAAADTAALPGEHQGGFQRQFTEPVPVTQSVHLEADAADGPPPTRLPRSAPWALTFGILGLIVSFLVGWGFLIGLVGMVLAVAALRRPRESRPIAVWAMCLSALSILYSAGWLWWASAQGPLFG